MRTVEIPGGTAVLREREDVKVRHRRLIESATVPAMPALVKVSPDPCVKCKGSGKAAKGRDCPVCGGSGTVAKADPEQLTAQEANDLFALQDATIVALLVSWTLPDDIPTLGTVGDMDPVIYDALAEATRTVGASVAAADSFDETPDDGSPTVPSADSATGSREAGGSRSTRRSMPVGKSSVTAGSAGA